MAEAKHNYIQRPPVVAVVGHVDHGKTALLDYIRKTNVVSKEAGGITQSIGAYEVEHAGKKITFIDTPGHEAFTKMRAHGASAADMAILVVASDEGVKQQTKEALGILRETKTPFIVALTKVDKENVNLEKVKGDLMSEGVYLEGAGGDVSWQKISSKSGEGIKELLELILLMGEVLELKYDPSADAEGFIIESQKDPRRGVLAHLVLKNGTLHRGDDIKTITASGKIKILENFLGKTVEELIPSSPASVIGFNDIPGAGEEFYTGDVDLSSLVDVSKNAKEVNDGSESGADRIKAIVKADTDGSLDALRNLLKDEVEVIESSVGDITGNDIKNARSTGSIVVGFMVKPKKEIESMAELQDIKIFTSNIIYQLLDAVKLLKQKEKEAFTGGELEVLATFSSAGSKQTIGGRVVRGTVRVNTVIEVERAGEILSKGRIKSLQCEKENKSEVGIDKECGLVVETSAPIEKGDLIKAVI